MASKPTSPYARRQKSPRRYSGEHREWYYAVKRGDDAARKDAGHRHTEKFAPWALDEEWQKKAKRQTAKLRRRRA